MEILKWFTLAVLSFTLVVIFAPFFFIGQIIFRAFSKKYDVQYYLESVAIGNDAAGGSYIYGSKLHTISAMTGYFANIPTKWHSIQARMIDSLFEDGHCYRVAIDEKMIKAADDN